MRDGMESSKQRSTYSCACWRGCRRRLCRLLIHRCRDKYQRLPCSSTATKGSKERKLIPCRWSRCRSGVGRGWLCRDARTVAHRHHGRAELCGNLSTRYKKRCRCRRSDGIKPSSSPQRATRKRNRHVHHSEAAAAAAALEAIDERGRGTVAST